MPVLAPKAPVGGITCAASPATRKRPRAKVSATRAEMSQAGMSTESRVSSRSGTPTAARTSSTQRSGVKSSALWPLSGKKETLMTHLRSLSSGMIVPRLGVVDVGGDDLPAAQRLLQVGVEEEADQVGEGAAAVGADGEEVADRAAAAVRGDHVRGAQFGALAGPDVGEGRGDAVGGLGDGVQPGVEAQVDADLLGPPAQDGFELVLVDQGPPGRADAADVLD
nr:hypothetical protein [Streptomyces sp. RB110-2]